MTTLPETVADTADTGDDLDLPATLDPSLVL